MSTGLNPNTAAEVPYPRSIPLPDGAAAPAYARLEVPARDGIKLIGHEWQPPKRSPGRPVLLFLHGIGMHGEPYEAVAAGFTSPNITLIVPDLRGHGRSEGQREELAEAKVLRGDIDDWLDFINKRHPNSPVFLLGDSMGGLIAADYARYGQKRLAGLVLMVPALGVNLTRLKAPSEEIVSFLTTGRVMIDSTENLAASTRAPGFTKAKQADPLATHEVKPTYLVRIAQMSLNWPAGADNIDLPLLVLLAGQDKVVDNALAKRVFGRVKTPAALKSLRIWDEAYHTLCWDIETPNVVKELTDWILERSK